MQKINLTFIFGCRLMEVKGSASDAEAWRDADEVERGVGGYNAIRNVIMKIITNNISILKN
jgi:hypothetical protein